MDDDFNIRPFGLFSQTVPQKPRDTSHLREREITIKQVDGGFIVNLTGGGHTWHQRVASNEDQLINMVRGFLSGGLTPKETETP